MKHKYCEYKVVRYAPGPEQEPGFAWLVLARTLRSPDALILHAAERWQERVRPQHRQYLSDLIAEWQQHQAAEAGTLFDRLDELSTGPVRAGGHGYASLEALAEEVRLVFKEQ